MGILALILHCAQTTQTVGRTSSVRRRALLSVYDRFYQMYNIPTLFLSLPMSFIITKEITVQFLSCLSTARREQPQIIAKALQLSEAARRRASHFPLYLSLRPPCQVRSRSTYLLLFYSVFTADTLRYVVTLTFDL